MICEVCNSTLIIRKTQDVKVNGLEGLLVPSPRATCAQCGAFELYPGEERPGSELRWAQHGDPIVIKTYSWSNSADDIIEDDIPF